MQDKRTRTHSHSQRQSMDVVAEGCQSCFRHDDVSRSFGDISMHLESRLPEDDRLLRWVALTHFARKIYDQGKNGIDTKSDGHFRCACTRARGKLAETQALLIHRKAIRWFISSLHPCVGSKPYVDTIHAHFLVRLVNDSNA